MNTVQPDSKPGISLLGVRTSGLEEAISSGGGRLVPLSTETSGLIVDRHADIDHLNDLLIEHPAIGWIQLPSAGIERYSKPIQANPDRIWTSAKGAFARPVGEHILALTLAMLRHLPERSRAASWGIQKGTTLEGRSIVIVGAGGIGQEAVRLFSAFNTRITVVRRKTEAVAGADRTITVADLPTVLPHTDVLILAAALTSDTTRLIGAPELQLLKRTSILVNIARGKLIDTDALIQALAGGRLAGAALDVTDPEPLPDGHPLWNESRCLITPHTADTEEMVQPLIHARVRSNVRRWAAGRPLEGQIDIKAGY